MFREALRFVTVIGILFGWSATPAQAAGRVQLTVIADRAAPITAQQEWLRVLAQAGVSGARITNSALGRKLGVEVKGDAASPTYLVTARLDSRGDLVLPGKRFRQSEGDRLGRWLAQLAAEGLPGKQDSKSAFGLDRELFERVYADMAQPVGFATTGQSRDEVIRRIGRDLGFPLHVDPIAARSIDDDALSDELMGLSRGTALAYLLRPAGMAMVPRAAGPGRVRYEVSAPEPGEPVWPVGWESEQPRRKVVPGLFEFLTVNVQDVSVKKAVDAVAERLKLPVLWDHSALAAQGIEPERVMASVPSTRTTYSLLLRRVLFQGGLKGEVRVDEADGPLLWITTIKRD